MPEWTPKTATPVQPEQWRPESATRVDQEKIGIKETFQRADAMDVLGHLPIPYNPYMGFKKWEYNRAKKRLKKGDYGTSTSTYGLSMTGGYTKIDSPYSIKTDKAIIQDWESKRKEEAVRGVTKPAKIASAITDTLPWVADIALTGGARKGVTTTLQGAMKSKGLAKGLALLVNAGVTASQQPGRVRETTEEIKINNPELSERQAMVKASKSLYISNLAELSGEYITKGFVKYGGGALKKMPFTRKLLDKMKPVWMRATGGTTAMWANKISDATGINSLIGEIGEERFETILQATLNDEDFGAGKDAGALQRVKAGLTQDMHNLDIEIPTLMFPTTGRYVASRLMGRATEQRQDFQQEQAEVEQQEKRMTKERELEIKEGRGAEPTDRETMEFINLGAEQAETQLFESEKIRAQQEAEKDTGGKLVEQEQGERAFTPKEAVTEKPPVRPDMPVVAKAPEKTKPNTAKELDDELQKKVPLFNTGLNDLRRKLFPDIGDLPSAERKAKQVSVNNAIEQGIPEKAVDLASEVIVSQRPITDEELAGMGVRLVQLEDEASSLENTILEPKNSADKTMAVAQLDILERQIDLVTKGMRTGKEHLARGLSMAGSFVNESYRVSSIKARMREAKGAPLTEKESTQVVKLVKQLEDANTRIAKLQERADTNTANRFVKSGKRTTRAIQKRTTDIKSLSEKINKLIDQGCMN